MFGDDYLDNQKKSRFPTSWKFNITLITITKENITWKSMDLESNGSRIYK